MMVFPNLRKENALKLADKFISKFAASIVAVLSCFDRVIFKGHLPFGGDGHLNAFVDGVLKMRRKDFIAFLQEQSQRLVEHAQKVAEREGCPYRYLPGKCRKEKLIQQMIRQDQLSDGLVAVVCCQETFQLQIIRRRGGVCILF